MTAGKETRSQPRDGHTEHGKGWGTHQRIYQPPAAPTILMPILHLSPPWSPCPPSWPPSAPKPLLPRCQLLFLASFSFLPKRAEGKQLPSKPWRLGLPVVVGKNCGSGDRQAEVLLSDLSKAVTHLKLHFLVCSVWIIGLLRRRKELVRVWHIANVQYMGSLPGLASWTGIYCTLPRLRQVLQCTDCPIHALQRLRHKWHSFIYGNCWLGVIVAI